MTRTEQPWVAADVGNTGIQPGLWVEAVEQLAGAHKMDVGQMDQFHRMITLKIGAGQAGRPLCKADGRESTKLD